MKYSYNTNQKAIVDNNLNREIIIKDRGKEITKKANIITFHILDYLKDFSFNKNKKTRDVEGKSYIWINYNHIIENNPLLDLTRDSVRVHFQILLALNLISLFKDADNTLYYYLEDIEMLNFEANVNLRKVAENSASSKKNTSGANVNLHQHNNNNHSSIKEENIIINNNIKEKFPFTLNRKTKYINLSKEYKEKLQYEIKNLNGSLSFEDFIESLEANGYQYANFLMAYKNWNKRNYNKPNQNKQAQTKNSIDNYFSKKEAIDAEVSQWKK